MARRRKKNGYEARRRRGRRIGEMKAVERELKRTSDTLKGIGDDIGIAFREIFGEEDDRDTVTLGGKKWRVRSNPMAAKGLNIVTLLAGAGIAYVMWKAFGPPRIQRAPEDGGVAVPPQEHRPVTVADQIDNQWLESVLPPSVSLSLSQAQVAELVAQRRLPPDAVLAYIDPQLEQSVRYLGNGVYLITPDVANLQSPARPLPLDVMREAAIPEDQPAIPGTGEWFGIGHCIVPMEGTYRI